MADLLHDYPLQFACAIMAIVGIVTLVVGILRRSSLMLGAGLFIIFGAVLIAAFGGLMNQPLMPHYEPIHP